ncbi:hypothetical protein DAPPUDRAFT_332775 [Daphnia pulex]|uniref:Transposable element P transposase-like RNase H domain-containing protein n=1 Tax=Daphnia pulex TaxID=6669 RepID=E9HQX7_DAPPU|nr:hypothetical protein DAPPUDRAFT_332775 [Daphnia pulex]|eukprot:EFX65857.1 hypothetical protein DAPPUDRAFT_332775 [Daphnia pulex]
MAFPTLLLRGTQNQINLLLVQPIQAKSTSSKYKIGEMPEIRESPIEDVSADPVEVASSTKLRSSQMKECEVIDLTNYHNEESYEGNSEKWEANVYSKELESNVDALQMQESEINDHFSVISNPQSFTDDPNLLLNSSNDVEMQHEILSQVDITCSTLKSSSRTNRKIPRKGIAEEEGKKKFRTKCNSKFLTESIVKNVEFGMINGPLNTASFYREKQGAKLVLRMKQWDPPRIAPGAAFQENEEKQSKNSSSDPILANSLLNFMVTGLTTKFSALVGSWPVAKLNARQLYFVTLHVIKTLESIGFLVDRIVGDNASVNV